MNIPQLTPDSTLGELPTHESSITAETLGAVVASTFEQQPHLPGVIVLQVQKSKTSENTALKSKTLEDKALKSKTSEGKTSEGKISEGAQALPETRLVAMISRQVFLERLSQPYGLEIFLKRPIQSFLLIAEIGEPLILPATERIDSAVPKALQRPSDRLYEPILIQGEAGNWSLLDFQVLLLAQTQILSLQKEELQLANERIQTTQKQMIAQEKLASLGGLTAGIAHEIRNPLNFVNNYAELVIDLNQRLLEKFETCRDSLEPKVAESMTKIIQKLSQNASKIDHYGKRAEKIVSNMLMHYRGGERRWEWVEINELIAEAVNLAYHGMRAKDLTFNVTFESDYDATIGAIEIVPQDINRVLINIISNACYAVHKRWQTEGDSFIPIIQVSSHDLGEAIEIRIRDNGCGIPPDIMDKIFDHFFTTKPSGEGTGLGLSLSYEIIADQHQGNLEVESEVNDHTQFKITLPKQSTSDHSHNKPPITNKTVSEDHGTESFPFGNTP